MPVEVLGLADHATFRDNWPLLRSTEDALDPPASGDAGLVSERLARRLESGCVLFLCQAGFFFFFFSYICTSGAELQPLLAVAHHVQRVLDLVILEGLPGREDVAFVVLYQEARRFSGLRAQSSASFARVSSSPSWCVVSQAWAA